MGFFYGKTTWIDGTGTRLAGADNDYHGDLSLLNVEDAGNNIGDSIWVSNTDKRFVTTRTAPALGESLCRYGVRSRLDCQFITAKVNALLEYGDGDKLRKGDAAYLETAPSVSACSMDGDSGGPVFVPIGTGSARAVGVISGRLSAAVGCYLLFTGVEEAHQAWGGDINFH